MMPVYCISGPLTAGCFFDEIGEEYNMLRSSNAIDECEAIDGEMISGRTEIGTPEIRCVTKGAEGNKGNKVQANHQNSLKPDQLHAMHGRRVAYRKS